MIQEAPLVKGRCCKLHVAGTLPDVRKVSIYGAEKLLRPILQTDLEDVKFSKLLPISQHSLKFSLHNIRLTPVNSFCICCVYKCEHF